MAVGLMRMRQLSSRLGLTAAALVLSACQTLPSLQERHASFALPAAPSPALEQALLLPQFSANDAVAASEPETEEARQPEQLMQPESENDGLPLQMAASAADMPQAPKLAAHLYVLGDPKDAFSARIALADHAVRSLDIQYYIWRQDLSGSLLLQKVYAAAKRGVRVRLLLDDNNTAGMDDVLAALNRHPKIEVRLFNPFLYRRVRSWGYLTDFPRLNRRMHNKSFTADNRVSIVGGRNIGDEYFDIGGDTAFADVDVLAGGPLVGHISRDFDRYWNSDSAYPFEAIVGQADAAAGKRRLATDRSLEPAYAAYQSALAGAPLNRALAQGRVPYIAAPVQLISDDPAKALQRNVRVDIAAQLAQALQQPLRELYLVSPYFVPTRQGTQLLGQLAQSGVRVGVLTNSLRATDVAAVHSGYARYRKPLLRAGVELYEFKADNAAFANKDRGLTGSSAASLHAKTFVADRERVFIGSFNFDPRSARLNTEMGLVIHHKPLAGTMQRYLDTFTAQTAYRLSLDGQQRIRWHNPDTGQVLDKEPEAGFWKRLTAKILSYLPIERLL